MLCKRILTTSLAAMLILNLSGCVFDDDSDVLNRANDREAERLGIEISFLCYDDFGAPYMEGHSIEVNGEEYRCVISDDGSKWLLVAELLDEL